MQHAVLVTVHRGDAAHGKELSQRDLGAFHRQRRPSCMVTLITATAKELPEVMKQLARQRYDERLYSLHLDGPASAQVAEVFASPSWEPLHLPVAQAA